VDVFHTSRGLPMWNSFERRRRPRPRLAFVTIRTTNKHICVGWDLGSYKELPNWGKEKINPFRKEITHSGGRKSVGAEILANEFIRGSLSLGERRESTRPPRLCASMGLVEDSDVVWLSVPRSVRWTERLDRTHRNKFGFLGLLTEGTTEYLGFGHFGFGLGSIGSVIRFSGKMPTPRRH
jgi:hypothetical protein